MGVTIAAMKKAKAVKRASSKKRAQSAAGGAGGGGGARGACGSGRSGERGRPAGKVETTATETQRRRFRRRKPFRGVRYEIRHDLQEKRADLVSDSRVVGLFAEHAPEADQGGGVKINGRGAKSSTVLRAGDVVEVTLPHGRRRKAAGEYSAGRCL